MNEKMRVHFTGGPADGDVRLIHPAPIYQVPVVEQSSEIPTYDPRCPSCTERLLRPVRCSTAIYYIRRVGEKCWIAIHEDLA